MPDTEVDFCHLLAMAPLSSELRPKCQLIMEL